MSKRAIAFFSCCLFSFSTLARENCISGEFEANLNQLEEVTAKVEDCPKPSDDMFEQMCKFIDTKDMKYKEHLMKMSCADKQKDSPITVNSKVKHTWDTYKKDFYCTADGFRVDQGNILKYSVYQDFPIFVDGVVKTFDLDINFKDPSDGKTVLDYIQDEIAAYKKLKNSKDKLAQLEELYVRFKKAPLNAKHASELPK